MCYASYLDCKNVKMHTHKTTEHVVIIREQSNIDPKVQSCSIDCDHTNSWLQIMICYYTLEIS